MDELTAERYPEFTGRRLHGHAARMWMPGYGPPPTPSTPQEQEQRQRLLLELDDDGEGKEAG